MINLFILFQVCKRWQIWADQIKLKELVLFNPHFVKVCWSWHWNFYTANSIDEDVMITGDLNLFRSIPFNFNQLNRLKVCGFNSEILKVINKLTYLEHLESVNLRLDGMETTLNLPILKALEIDGIKSDRTSKPIIIDAPMLKYFGFFGQISRHFKILNPRSITYLKVTWGEIHNLDEYASVEIYKVGCVHAIDQNLFEQLPNLREFHFHGDVSELLYYNRIAFAMDNFLEQKAVHGKHDLKVYFFFFFLEPGKKFNDYDFCNKYHQIFNEYLSDEEEYLYYSSDSSDYSYQLSDSD